VPRSGFEGLLVCDSTVLHNQDDRLAQVRKLEDSCNITHTHDRLAGDASCSNSQVQLASRTGVLLASTKLAPAIRRATCKPTHSCLHTHSGGSTSAT
jgi:hypothetical protein